MSAMLTLLIGTALIVGTNAPQLFDSIAESALVFPEPATPGAETTGRENPAAVAQATKRAARKAERATKQARRGKDTNLAGSSGRDNETSPRTSITFGTPVASSTTDQPSGSGAGTIPAPNE